jgi:hypothetical protein
MRREAVPASIAAAIGDQSRDARLLLGWLRLLGPLDTRNLATASRQPLGGVFADCRQLVSAGLMTSHRGLWQLSGVATAWADQQDRDEAQAPAPTGPLESWPNDEP